MNLKLVSIFIPAANEEKNIIPLVKKIDNAVQLEHNYDFEIVVIDDGSADNTKKELEKVASIYPYIRYFSHLRNLGLTEAMKTGFSKVKGNFIIFLPADLESDPEEDIPKLLRGLESGLDLVCGWRQNRKDGKLLASKIYNIVSKYLFNVTVHDMNWIKAFKREVMEDFELRSDWHRFIVMMAANKGYKIGEVKTNWYPRNFGKSKFGLMRFPTSLVDVLVVKFNMVFGNKPMHFFSLLGTLIIIISISILIFLAIYYFLYQTQIRPLFNLSAILIIAGIQLFMTGFLAELVVSKKDDIQQIKKEIKLLKEKLDEK